MTDQSIKTQAQIYTELLQRLSAENECYPWILEAADNYFENSDTESPLGDYLESEAINDHCQPFFEQIQRLYPVSKLESVTEFLLGQFGNLVPVSWLEAIAQQAQQTVNQNLSSIDELVDCVQPLLLNWSTEDLQVFARPVATLMRSPGLQPPQQKAWFELSTIEQARLSLLIAKSALDAWKNKDNLQ